MRLCLVDTCDRKAFRRGYCEPHYRRILRTGDVQWDVPLTRRRRYASLEEELANETTVQCPRVWSGPVNRDGFGVTASKLRPHRLVWEQARGEQLGRRRVIHTCGNKLCLTPEHIVLLKGDGGERAGY